MLIEHFELDEYKKLILNNNKEKLFKIGLNKNIKIEREDCFLKCGKTQCIELDARTKVLDKCMKCNSQKNKCFKKSIIGGVCNDCDETTETKIECNAITNFGCTPPDNLDSNNGVEPYYIQMPDNNINSPFNEKCVFCWNFSSEI